MRLRGRSQAQTSSQDDPARLLLSLIDAKETGEGTSSGSRDGIVLVKGGSVRKEKSDLDFFYGSEFHFWVPREAIKRKRKVRPGKSWAGTDHEENIPFQGYHHLRRSCVVCAEIFIAPEEEDVPLAMGLLAKWMSVQEEVPRGLEWGTAMRMMPIEDPVEDGLLGTVSAEEYMVALAYQKELEALAGRRKGNRTGQQRRPWWQRNQQ